MDLDPIKQDIVTASHILHRQGIAAAFGHLSARIPGTDTFIFPPRMSPALVRLDNLLVLDVEEKPVDREVAPPSVLLDIAPLVVVRDQQIFVFSLVSVRTDGVTVLGVWVGGTLGVA